MQRYNVLLSNLIDTGYNCCAQSGTLVLNILQTKISNLRRDLNTELWNLDHDINISVTSYNVAYYLLARTKLNVWIRTDSLKTPIFQQKINKTLISLWINSYTLNWILLHSIAKQRYSSGTKYGVQTNFFENISAVTHPTAAMTNELQSALNFSDDVIINIRFHKQAVSGLHVLPYRGWFTIFTRIDWRDTKSFLLLFRVAHSNCFLLHFTAYFTVSITTNLVLFFFCSIIGASRERVVPLFLFANFGIINKDWFA